MERRRFLTDSAKYAALTVAGTTMLQNKLMASNTSLFKNHLTDFNNRSFIHQSSNYHNVSTVVKLKGKEVKVHALCTGTVAVKRNFRTKKGAGMMAKVNILLDNHYTEYLPIWVWIVEHPEGIIAIDTGEVIEAKDRENYLSKESAYSRYVSQHTSRFNLEKEDELNFQMAKVNLTPRDVKLVVLTHLHLDHTDGLKFFPNQEIMVGETEFKHPYSNLPSTYPFWFKPTLVNYKNNRVEVFDKAFPITKAEDLLYVPTPGHTQGHSSVVLKTDDYDIIFAGDVSYNQEQVLNGELAGVNLDFKQSMETYWKLITYASKRPTIYLPTHDGNSGIRLSNKALLV